MNRSFRCILTKVTNRLRNVFRDLTYRMHGVLHDAVTISTRQGRLTLQTKNDHVAKCLFQARQYEYDNSLRAVHFLKRMRFIQGANMCMLDVGSNIGMITTGLLLANEIQNAIAIEPEAKNFSLLVKNVIQNGLSKRVCCLQVAVGNMAKNLTMEISPSNAGDHRIRASSAFHAAERYNESSRETVQVKALPLREILKLPEICNAGMAKPNLLWIDVQGYEGYVFEGGRDFLSLGIPAISEIWPYGICRSGMSLERFVSIVSSIWSDYWVERREKYSRYPISVFDCYLKELGTDGYSENVIFTKGGTPTDSPIFP